MFDRIIVVSKKTPLEELLLRHHSRSQAQFFIERRGASFSEYEAADAAYHQSLDEVLAAVPRELPSMLLPREQIPTFLFREKDLLIAVGPDGLFVNLAKYLGGQPILTVNPDPQRIDGVLMRFSASEVPRLLSHLDRPVPFPLQQVSLARAQMNDGQTLYAVNDFMVGRRDQVAARYLIRHAAREERQCSSGVLVSTGVGSSGWLRSLQTGAAAVMQDKSTRRSPFPWESRFLVYAVREPFPTRYTQTSLVYGTIAEGEQLVMVSEMGEGGALFSDGVVEDAIEFNAGAIVEIGLADKVASLVARRR
jgi:hypothetical protein